MFGHGSFAAAPFAGLLSTTTPVVVVATVTGVLIGIGLTSPLVWGIIDDGQTSGWVAVTNTQSAGWAAIDDSQSVSWVPVTDTQAGAWVDVSTTPASTWTQIPV